MIDTKLSIQLVKKGEKVCLPIDSIQTIGTSGGYVMADATEDGMTISWHGVKIFIKKSDFLKFGISIRKAPKPRKKGESCHQSH